MPVPLGAPSLPASIVGGHVLVFADGDVHEFTAARAKLSGETAGAAGGGVISPMPGNVIAVTVKAGDDVTKGQALLTLEAMKMEYTLTAAFAGKVEAVLAKVGDQVSEGMPLVRLDFRKAITERSVAGLYFDEFSVGMTFQHAIRRTIPEEDNVFFTAMTHSLAALHLDEEYCKTTEFGTRIVNSCLTLSFMVGISVGETTLGTAVANLGWDEVRRSPFSWRYDPRGERSAGTGAEQVAPGARHLHLRLPCLQSKK